MTHLHFSMTIAGDPCCPVCCSPLLADLWSVQHGIAFCPLCSDSALLAIKHARLRVRFLHHYQRDPRHWSVSHGIAFYTGQQPLTPLPRQLYALLPDDSITHDEHLRLP